MSQKSPQPKIRKKPVSPNTFDVAWGIMKESAEDEKKYKEWLHSDRPCSECGERNMAENACGGGADRCNECCDEPCCSD